MSWSAQRNERLHSLLPWQIYALAAMTGLFAAQYFTPALTMLFLLLLGTADTGSRWRGFIVETRWRALLRTIALIMTFALGWLYAFAQTPNNEVYDFLHYKEEAPPWIQTKQRITGLVSAVEGLPDHRLRITLDGVQPVQDAPECFAEQGDLSCEASQGLRVIWTWEKPYLEHGMRPMVGQRIKATLNVKKIDGFANPDNFDIERFWAMKGIYYRAWAKEEMPEFRVLSAPHQSALWRENLRLRVDRSLHAIAHLGLRGIGHHNNVDLSALADTNNQSSSEENLHMAAASVIMGLLFGDRFYMDSRLLDYFARTDLLHTLALSGQHLVIAGFFASLCIFFLRKYSTNIFYSISRQKLFYLLCLPCAAFYLWLGNAPPSLVRASTMLLVWALLICLSRRQATLLDVLLCALTSILIVSPLSIFDLGMQLSSLAVAALLASLVVTQHCMRWLGLKGKKETGNITQHEAKTAFLREDVYLAEGFVARFCAYAKFCMYIMGTRLSAIAPKAAYAMFFLAISSTLVQIILLPVQLMVFAKASPWFLLNIPWIPLTDMLLLPLSFMGMLCHAAPDLWLFFPLHILGDICFWLAMQISFGMTIFLEYLNEAGMLDVPALWRPHWTTAVGYGGLMLCALLRLGRQRLPYSIRRVALVSFLLFFIGFGLMLKDAYDDRLHMTVFDVGMGQAVHIRTPDNMKIMIDGGGFYSQRFDTGRDIVARALTDNQWPRLDMIINSHPDNDHLRGLIYLLQAFPVHYYGYNGDDNAKGNEHALKKALHDAELTATPLTAGMTLPLGPHLHLEILHPSPSDYDAETLYDAGNDASLVTRLVYTGPKAPAQGLGLAMLCGDVEKKGLQEFLQYAKKSGADLSAEILILPHHGSKSSYLPELYDAVQPRVAIASCAKNHRYNYPHKEIADEFARRHIPLFNTGTHGAIHCTWEVLGDKLSQGHISYERHSEQ